MPAPTRHRRLIRDVCALLMLLGVLGGIVAGILWVVGRFHLGPDFRSMILPGVLIVVGIGAVNGVLIAIDRLLDRLTSARDGAGRRTVGGSRCP